MPASTRAPPTFCPVSRRVLTLPPSAARHRSPSPQVDDTVKRAKEEGDLPLVGYKDVSERVLQFVNPGTQLGGATIGARPAA